MKLSIPILDEIETAELYLRSARSYPNAASFYLKEASRCAEKAASLHHARQVRQTRSQPSTPQPSTPKTT